MDYTLYNGSDIVIQGRAEESKSVSVDNMRSVLYTLNLSIHQKNSQVKNETHNILIVEHMIEQQNLKPLFGLANSQATGFDTWWEYSTSMTITTQNDGIMRVVKTQPTASGGVVAGILTSNFIDCSQYKFLCVLYKSKNYTPAFHATEQTKKGSTGSYGPGDHENGIITENGVEQETEDGIYVAYPLAGWNKNCRIGIARFGGSFDVEIKSMWLAI